MGEQTFLFESYRDLAQKIDFDSPITARFVVIRHFEAAEKGLEPDIANIFQSGSCAQDSYHLIIESDGQDFALSHPVMSASVAPRYIPGTTRYQNGKLRQDIGAPGMRSLNGYFSDMLACVIHAHYSALESIAPVLSIELQGETIEDVVLKEEQVKQFLESADWIFSVDETAEVVSVPHFAVSADYGLPG